METVVYTFKSCDYWLHTDFKEQKAWLEDSVKSAKAVGYNTVLYTDNEDFAADSNIDIVEVRQDSSYVWDSLKIRVLDENIYSNYFLCDNDVIFKKRIEFDNNIDLSFDIIERKYTWESVYKPTLKKIRKLGILDELDYWEHDLGITYNIGVLKLNSDILRKEYINKWKEISISLTPYIDNELNPFYLTPIISQYLLTVISQKYNTKPLGTYREYPEPENEFYTHFRGGLKRKRNNNLI